MGPTEVTRSGFPYQQAGGPHACVIYADQRTVLSEGKIDLHCLSGRRGTAERRLMLAIPVISHNNHLTSHLILFTLIDPDLIRDGVAFNQARLAAMELANQIDGAPKNGDFIIVQDACSR